MLEVRTLRQVDNPDGPNLITYILKIKGLFPIIVREKYDNRKVGRERCDMKTRSAVALFEDSERLGP